MTEYTQVATKERVDTAASTWAQVGSVLYVHPGLLMRGNNMSEKITVDRSFDNDGVEIGSRPDDMPDDVKLWPGKTACNAETSDGVWLCHREVGHAGQHLATDMPGTVVYVGWTA